MKDKVIINRKPYKIPFALRKPVQDELDKLISLGVIRKSQSLFSSPAFPIRKRNGRIRLVIDYRDLNKYTIPINQPFPTINDCLLTINGSKVFSQIDLNSGYYQIPLEAKSIKYTAFSIGDNHYEFLRMPFGLTNAPMTFEKMHE